jgi:hypothetical protein
VESVSYVDVLLSALRIVFLHLHGVARPMVEVFGDRHSPKLVFKAIEVLKMRDICMPLAKRLNVQTLQQMHVWMEAWVVGRARRPMNFLECCVVETMSLI